ncbi:Uncharacterised protein [Mycobacteroides abscessus subsp. abscessus]|nr:Uncharacterised protein [Mycobacteroides abscessus subsp. abscessus]
MRLHPEMFGSRTPVNSSRNRSTDVWSKGSPATHPPTDHGEITMAGTRNPPPIGTPLTHSPGVPGGGVGGTTWSNRPSFSS